MKDYKTLSKKDYQEICTLLNINRFTDEKATKYINDKLDEKKAKKTLDILQRKIKNKIVFIFGAGPTLLTVLKEFASLIYEKRKKLVVIAVDGATTALLEFSIKIDIIVSDLDGNLDSIKESYQKNNSLIVVHAHGDNLDKLYTFSSMLSQNNILGTTQIERMDKVLNLGGFTDGDRAAYLAANMKAKSIILFAFDFGKMVGKYSKPTFSYNQPADERKLMKFKIAKKLLGKIPYEFPQTRIFNYSLAKTIPNIPQITLTQIENILYNGIKDNIF